MWIKGLPKIDGCYWLRENRSEAFIVRINSLNVFYIGTDEFSQSKPEDCEYWSEPLREPEVKAAKLASEWLLAHEYKQFADGTWHYNGYEVLLDNALAEYILDRSTH